MKTNAELASSLNMVLARLQSNPKTAAEWDTIRRALVASKNYAQKVYHMRNKLENAEGDKNQ